MLKSVYPILFMDAIHYAIRKDGVLAQRAVYIAIGIDLEGQKNVLGLWIGDNESSKFWLNIMNELKNRGVRDILIASVDGLSGFSEAIRASISTDRDTTMHSAPDKEFYKVYFIQGFEGIHS